MIRLRIVSGLDDGAAALRSQWVDIQGLRVAPLPGILRRPPEADSSERQICFFVFTSAGWEAETEIASAGREGPRKDSFLLSREGKEVADASSA